MKKIPQYDKRIVVTNGVNALEGLISYTKNIDLSEKGYIKLSPPMVKIFSDQVSEGGDIDLDLPIDIFAYNTGAYKVVTGDRAFNIDISTMSISEDSGFTSWVNETRIVNWVGNNWHVNGGAVDSYTAASGNSVYTQVINKALKYIELFTNRNSLVGAFGDNTVWQYDTSYANTINLTIPPNFVITGLAYSNNMMGVITRQKKNQGNAYFFIWDGSTTSANSGYPVNDSLITSIAAYKSSWVITTSSGQLLYFNGGGFDELGSLPTFRFEDDLASLAPNSSINLGNIVDVDGDVVYLNCGSLPEFSTENKPYRPGFSGGMYCYDPDASFYHKHAPSYSRYAPENASVTSNVLTLSASNYLKTGDEIWLRADDQGLTGRRVYYAIVLTPTTIKLADTYQDALNNINVTITNGTLNDIFYVKRTDYGIESVKIDDLGLVKKARDYEGFQNSGVVPTFLGAQVRPNDVSVNTVTVLNALVPAMSNIGYFITTKFQSADLENSWQGISIKYSQLSSQSSIVVKGKVKDQDALIIGDMTLHNSGYVGPSITWDANGIKFDTSSDLSSVEVGDEVHVFCGAGAGQSANILSITLTGTTYTVVLDEQLRGIISNAKSCVSIDKWIRLGTITAADTNGNKYLPLAKTSPTLEVKCELRGIGVKISEVIPINATHKPAV